MLVNLEIEPEARAIIAEGLKKTTCLRDLQVALRDDADAAEIDLEKLVDLEVRAAAGLFFGLARAIDVDDCPKTFQFCLSLLTALNDEYERRLWSANAN